MEQFPDLFKTAGVNHVAMFAKLFCSVLVIQILIGFQRQLHYFKTQPSRIYGKPIKLLGLFQLPSLNEHQFIFFGIALITSLSCVAIGIFPRLFIWIAFFSYFPYFNSILSLDYIQRKTNLLPFVLLILAVSSSLSTPLDAPATTWEIVLIKIGIAQLYFSAGLQKLRHAGISWCSGKALQAHLLENFLWSDRKSAYLLARRQWLCAVFSTLTLIFELSFWIIIFLPQLTMLYVATALFFHIGTLITMRINYLKYLSPVYMIFFTTIAFEVKNYLGI